MKQTRGQGKLAEGGGLRSAAGVWERTSGRAQGQRSEPSVARGGLEGRWTGGQAAPSKDQALPLSEVVGLGLVL